MKRIMYNRTALVLLVCSRMALSDAFARHYWYRNSFGLCNRVHTDDLQVSSQQKININLSHTESACAALMMTKNEDNEGIDNETQTVPFSSKLESFFDAFLEIPDARLFYGDILFLLIVNFLLQIASEVGDPNFWASGGFNQPVTMPTTLSALVVRDSKMTISWIIAGLWNRAYSTSSVFNDNIAIKKAVDVWVDYFSLRIILELVGSILITHNPVDTWPLAQEVWYTLIVMAFYRLSYGRFLSNLF